MPSTIGRRHDSTTISRDRNMTLNPRGAGTCIMLGRTSCTRHNTTSPSPSLLTSDDGACVDRPQAVHRAADSSCAGALGAGGPCRHWHMPPALPVVESVLPPSLLSVSLSGGRWPAPLPSRPRRLLPPRLGAKSGAPWRRRRLRGRLRWAVPCRGRRGFGIVNVNSKGSVWAPSPSPSPSPRPPCAGG